MVTKKANGEGGIRKRSNGAWEASLTVGYAENGEQKRKFFSGKTKLEALEKRDKAKADLGSGLFIDADGLTVTEYFEKWFKHIAQDKAPSTVSGYMRTFNKAIKPTIGRVRLDKLRPIQVQDLYSTLLAEGTGRWTVRYAHTVLHAALEQAREWELVSRNVADAVRPPERAEKSDMTIWSPAEASRFLEHTQAHRLHGLFYLALMTGMRKGELLGLHWGDVSLGRSEINVRMNLTEVGGKLYLREPKTKASRRTILIPSDTVKVLQEHHAALERHKLLLGAAWDEQDLVFPSELGTPLSPANVYRLFKNIIKRAGVPNIRFHDLRHTHASLLILKGTSAKVVSDRLGHTDVGFTLNTYTHLFDEQRREAAMSFDDLFGPAVAGLN